MLLKYLNKGIELVRSMDGKIEVKEGDVFETPDHIGEGLMRNYKGMFEKVGLEKEDNEEEEKKENKKQKKNK